MKPLHIRHCRHKVDGQVARIDDPRKPDRESSRVEVVEVSPHVTLIPPPAGKQRDSKWI
jgi:hypothetical protein